MSYSTIDSADDNQGTASVQSDRSSFLDVVSLLFITATGTSLATVSLSLIKEYVYHVADLMLVTRLNVRWTPKKEAGQLQSSVDEVDRKLPIYTGAARSLEQGLSISHAHFQIHKTESRGSKMSPRSFKRRKRTVIQIKERSPL